jgi:hypothetical protein
MKRCPNCKVEKSLTDFRKNKRRVDGLAWECAECQRTRWRDYRKDNTERQATYQREYMQKNAERIYLSHVQRTYGVSPEDYLKVYEQQGGVCAICSDPPRPNTHLHLDHDHATNQFRGLLCSKCNQAIGLLNEDLNLLDKAAQYLVHWQATMNRNAA